MTTEIAFPFNERKAKEATAEILRLAGGVLDRFHIVKCAYLADRLSIARRERPICGGRYVSMKNGPVPIDVYSRFTAFVGDWHDAFEAGEDFEIQLIADVPPRALSQGDLDILRETYARYGQMPFSTLLALVHDAAVVPEYRIPVAPSKQVPISPASILRAVGRSEADLERICRDLEEEAELDASLPRIPV